MSSKPVVIFGDKITTLIDKGRGIVVALSDFSKAKIRLNES